MEGGITNDQFTFLMKRYQKREVQDMKFMASLHGIKMEDEPATHQSDVESGASTELFGDPEAYSKLPEAERERMTQEMMGHFKSWASNTPLKPKQE